MIIPIDAKKIEVLLTDGMDHINIYTTNPSPFVATHSKTDLVLEFKATYDMGVDYVRNVFGVEPEIKYLRTHMEDECESI